MAIATTMVTHVKEGGNADMFNLIISNALTSVGIRFR